jgi:uncharacterized membrane protein
MKLKTSTFIAIAIALLAVLALLAWAVPYFLNSAARTLTSGGTSRASWILSRRAKSPGRHASTGQRVELLGGEYEGLLMEIDYGKRQILSDGQTFAPGDEILVTLGQRPDGVLTAYYAERVRSKSLLWLLLAFVVSTLIMSGWKGARSLLAMAFSLAVIMGYIIPHILSGEDPVRVSIIGSAVLLGVTLYVTYGWTLKTHASVVAMVLALLLTGGLTWLFASLTRLTGVGSEDALFLLQMPDVKINLRGLMLGGMIIGALGVLDDLVTSQSSAVFELHHTDPAMGLRDLFRRGMRIGQDHIAATVNTLVLAYVGSSLPMLLLLTLARSDWTNVVNFEIIAVEVVRALVGSLGLIYAVPIATGIAGWLALNHERLGETARLLGPEGAGHSH